MSDHIDDCETCGEQVKTLLAERTTLAKALAASNADADRLRAARASESAAGVSKPGCQGWLERAIVLLERHAVSECNEVGDTDHPIEVKEFLREVRRG